MGGTDCSSSSSSSLSHRSRSHSLLPSFLHTILSPFPLHFTAPFIFPSEAQLTNNKKKIRKTLCIVESVLVRNHFQHTLQAHTGTIQKQKQARVVHVAFCLPFLVCLLHFVVEAFGISWLVINPRFSSFLFSLFISLHSCNPTKIPLFTEK